MGRLHDLYDQHRQSPWLDNLSRDSITDGTLRFERVAEVQPLRGVFRRRAANRGLHLGAHEAAPLFEGRALLGRPHELGRLSEIARDGDLQRAFLRHFPDRGRFR